MKNAAVYQTLIGEITIVENGQAITEILFGRPALSGEYAQVETPLLKEAAKQLNEYIAGERKKFDLPLLPKGTEFMQTVWKALLDIPHGETRTYAQIAAAIGAPKACRAVGSANGRNPIPIVIPCHRVIGTSGKLTGYAGGLAMKRTLLELEAAGNVDAG